MAIRQEYAVALALEFVHRGTHISHYTNNVLCKLSLLDLSNINFFIEFPICPVPFVPKVVTLPRHVQQVRLVLPLVLARHALIYVQWATFLQTGLLDVCRVTEVPSRKILAPPSAHNVRQVCLNMYFI